MASVVIVTGANQGIGRATAVRLARDCKAIVPEARNAEKLEETAQIVRSNNAKALVVDIDLAQPIAAEFIVTRTLEKFGRIDALVNISGTVPQIDLFDMTDEKWDGGLAVKFHGARRLTVRAWEALKASRGSVVFTSGNSADAPKAPYAAVRTINAARPSKSIF
jgi:NAD(P)-dependent dehydrogenase (short-subunit alcohol dehydrogenase family)